MQETTLNKVEQDELNQELLDTFNGIYSLIDMDISETVETVIYLSDMLKELDSTIEYMVEQKSAYIRNALKDNYGTSNVMEIRNELLGNARSWLKI